MYKIWKQIESSLKGGNITVSFNCFGAFVFLSGRSPLQKHLFSIMHSSWKHWWKAMSRIRCPTALYISVCSCSATRSWLDMWQRSVSSWTSWSQSSSTWWRVALLKVNFRVSCPNVSDYYSFWFSTPHHTYITIYEQHEVFCLFFKKIWKRFLILVTDHYLLWRYALLNCCFTRSRFSFKDDI